MADENAITNTKDQEVNGFTQSTVSPPTLTDLSTTHQTQDFTKYQPATLSLHADDSINILSDVAPPLHVSTTFRYTTDPSQLRPFRQESRPNAPLFPYQETPSEHCYSRLTTHSTSRLETILGSLIKAPCISYSSGLSAFHALLVHLCPKRVSIGAGYHGCHGVLELHIRMSGLKLLPLDCPAEELQAGDLIWLETPINPTGLAFSIEEYARKAHSRGAFLGVDSTFAPPPLQDPFSLGADVVMHSGTKYIGGHSDMLCGILAVKKELAVPVKDGQDLPQGQKWREGWMSRLLEDREFIGAVMGGLEGWLGVRSIRTLELRVQRQSRSATEIVRILDAALQDEVKALNKEDIAVIRKVLRNVQHASLQKSDLADGWLARQMPGGFGPVFAINLNGDELARHLPSKLHLFHHATSLGGVESLIEWRTMSDSTVSPEMLRVSIGIEDGQDLLNDLIQGFRALEKEFRL